MRLFIVWMSVTRRPWFVFNVIDNRAIPVKDYGVVTEKVSPLQGG